MTVIPLADRASTIDFDWEALKCAINEACEPGDTTCGLDNPCIYCQALAKMIEGALVRAYQAGRASTRPRKVVPDTIDAEFVAEVTSALDKVPSPGV